eukprot:4389480-Amphidinium_carterae.1
MLRTQARPCVETLKAKVRTAARNHDHHAHRNRDSKPPLLRVAKPLRVLNDHPVRALSTLKAHVVPLGRPKRQGNIPCGINRGKGSVYF